jgi:hypothetical protein
MTLLKGKLNLQIEYEGLPRSIAGTCPQRNLTTLFLFFLVSRFFVSGTPYLVHCLPGGRQVLGTSYNLLGTLYLVLSTWYIAVTIYFPSEAKEIT